MTFFSYIYMEKVFEKYPDFSHRGKEGDLGDVVAVVTMSDDSEVTTPLDQSIPIEIYIGKLKDINDDGHVLDKLTRFNRIETGENKGKYLATEIRDYTILTRNTVWKITEKGQKYLEEIWPYAWARTFGKS